MWYKHCSGKLPLLAEQLDSHLQHGNALQHHASPTQYTQQIQKQIKTEITRFTIAKCASAAVSFINLHLMKSRYTIVGIRRVHSNVLTAGSHIVRGWYQEDARLLLCHRMLPHFVCEFQGVLTYGCYPQQVFICCYINSV